MTDYLIVSIDGGGLRGAMPCRIMARIDEALPGWRDRVAMWAGTSTGALLGGGLATGWTPARLLEFYTDFGATIFQRDIGDKIADGWGTMGAMYSLDGLHAVLRGAFGEKTMGDAGPLVVTAFDLDKLTPYGRMWDVKVFENVTWPDSSDADVPLVDALMASAAAPVYFPDWKGYVDGGVYAGNPSLIAWAQTQDPRNRVTIPPSTVRVLSFGTGRVPHYLEGESVDRGLIDYGTDLVTMPLAGAGAGVEWVMDRALRGRHCRVQYTLPTPWGMDDWQAVPDMIAFADTVDIGPVLAWLSAT